MENQTFSATINDKSVDMVKIRKERPSIHLSVKEITGGLRLAMDLGQNTFYGLDIACQYIYYQNFIYNTDTVFAGYMKHLLKCFRETGRPEVAIPATAAATFLVAALPALETIAAMQVSPAVYDKFHQEMLEKHIYFDKYEDGMSARLEFHYGDITVTPGDKAEKEYPELNGKWLLRAEREENQLVDVFQQYGFRWLAGKLVQADEEATYCFLQQGLPEVRNMAEIFYADDFNIRLKNPVKISAGVRLNTESNMLDFSLDYDGMSTKELLGLLAAYKLKKRYHRLQDGVFIPLDSPEFQTAAELINQLGLRSADIEKKSVQLPKYRALYLDNLARETENFQIERSSAFKKMVQDIREPQDIEWAVPAGIHGTLRSYQKTGFKWLKSLATYGLGGILADDMGLGKTLQVITFVLSEKQSDPVPSLVIAPTSLLYNWQD